VADLTGPPVLQAEIGLSLGRLDLELALEVAGGEVVALLGPNGAGKTTMLRAVAGLQPIDRGRISIGGTVVDDPVAGVLVPAHQRPIGVLFQDHRLFPRLSALDNVAFGLRARGRSRRAARVEAARWLARLGLQSHATARPAALSGGQAQRVALARALAVEPPLLLLDEPLAALDATSRMEVRDALAGDLGSFVGARVLVTHDPVEAVVLADRLVIVEGGRLVQAGTPEEVVARPRTRFVADLVGINLLHGTGVGTPQVRLPTGTEVTAPEAVAPGPVALTIRPQAVALHRERPEGSPRNAWPLRIRAVEVHGGRARVRLDGRVPLTAEVTAAAVDAMALRIGDEVWAAVKAVDVTVHRR